MEKIDWVCPVCDAKNTVWCAECGVCQDCCTCPPAPGHDD